jgi:ATP-binding cassette, subfamily B, heavy metal transporter
MLAIVGPSGSGKSSVVRLLLRLLDAQSGRIVWGGKPVSCLDVGDLRHRIAVVPQDAILFNDTITANIGFGRPEATTSDIETAARLAQLHEWIMSLPGGYETRVGDRGLQVSGGERQRIAIARAILKCPQVYVFDEPTSMLDRATEAEVMRSISEISAGCATILITHRLTAASGADRIAVLHEGEVTESGSHRELLARNGIYARLWRADADDRRDCRTRRR